jgi:hypothetical protein
MAVEPPTRPVPPSTKTRAFLDLSLYSLWSSFVALHLNGNKWKGARTAMAASLCVSLWRGQTRETTLIYLARYRFVDDADVAPYAPK